MNSQTLPSFWSAYRRLPDDARVAAQKAYRLWSEFPFHPSLHFKCIDADERVWSARITLNYRALAIVEGDTATWFWIGSHQDYERQF